MSCHWGTSQLYGVGPRRPWWKRGSKDAVPPTWDQCLRGANWNRREAAKILVLPILMILFLFKSPNLSLWQESTAPKCKATKRETTILDALVGILRNIGDKCGTETWAKGGFSRVSWQIGRRMWGNEKDQRDVYEVIGLSNLTNGFVIFQDGKKCRRNRFREQGMKTLIWDI